MMAYATLWVRWPRKRTEQRRVLEKRVESIAVSGEIKETEERYRNLVIMLMSKFQDMEEVIKRNNVLLEDVMDMVREMEEK